VEQAKVLAAINGYEPADDTSQEGWVMLAEAAASLPKGPVMEEAVARLKAKKPVGGTEEASLPRRQIRKQIGELLEGGLWGSIKPEEKGEKIDKEEYLTAYEAHNRVSDAMETWFNANPKATSAEAGAQLAVVLEPSYVIGARRVIAPVTVTKENALDIINKYDLAPAKK
jgi:hypothetical protein